MPRYVAFLRGINVAGQKKIKMDDLRVLFEIYGFDDVTTYIQSGNVVFDTEETDTGIIRAKIEAMLLESYQFEVITLIRSQDDLEIMIDANPFEDMEDDVTVKLYVYMLSAEPKAELLPALQKVLLDKEAFEVIERELFFITPAYGETKLTNGVIEKKLGVSATARNWATINRVVDL